MNCGKLFLLSVMALISVSVQSSEQLDGDKDFTSSMSEKARHRCSREATGECCGKCRLGDVEDIDDIVYSEKHWPKNPWDVLQDASTDEDNDGVAREESGKSVASDLLRELSSESGSWADWTEEECSRRDFDSRYSPSTLTSPQSCGLKFGDKKPGKISYWVDDPLLRAEARQRAVSGAFKEDIERHRKGFGAIFPDSPEEGQSQERPQSR